jgi:hypothetical protein
MSRSGPCGSVTVFSELQCGTHRLEEIDTKDAGHPVVVNNLNLVTVDALLPWYPESEFSITEVLTK